MDIMDYIPQFGGALGGKTQDLSGIPQDDTLQQLELKRRLARAEALRTAEVPQGQMISGHYVPPSWTQYLANAVGKYQGAKQEREALKGYGDYVFQQKQKRQAGLDALAKALSPQAITEQGSYDIQVPSGKTPTPTDNLGGMQPYESGMKNISVPMTTTTGYRNPTSADVMSALSQYAIATNQPDFAEKIMMSKANQLMAPKQSEWKPLEGKFYEFDMYGRPTGKTIGEGKSFQAGSLEKGYEYAKSQGYPGSVQDYMRDRVSYINPYQAAQLGIEEKKLKLKEVEDNPLGLPKPSAQPSTSPLNKAPKTQSFKIDGMGSVNATYDAKTGKYFVMQGGKKFWVEE